MAPASNEEQFKFLISCIRYSNNGKVDFSQVAQECKIVSKGAAAKRYERMMRAHGIAPNATTVKPPPTRVTKTERRESRIPKKRKGDAFMEDNVAADDEETFANSIKPEPVSTKEELVVKEEHGTQDMARLALDTNAGFMQYMDDYSPSSYDKFETEPEYSFSSASYNNPQASYGYGVQANDSYSYAPTTMPINASSAMRTSSMGCTSSGMDAPSGGDTRGMYQHQTQQADNYYSQNSIVLD